MPKGILYVETWPASPEQEAEYHKWYDETHLQELVALEGIVSARRFTPIDHAGPFVAIYEIEAGDLRAVKARLDAALKSGKLSTPRGVQLDPPPVVRWFEQRSSYAS